MLLLISRMGRVTPVMEKLVLYHSAVPVGSGGEAQQAPKVFLLETVCRFN